MKATLEVFAAEGWSGFHFDLVAKRAGVHPTTIYRRWPTRGALIAAALAATPFRSLGGATPDTGSLRGDLHAFVNDLRAVLKVPRTRRIIRALDAAAGDPELAAAARNQYETRFAMVLSTVQRAIERGELSPDTNAELITHMFTGALRSQIIERQVNPPDRWFDELVEATIRAAGILPHRAPKSRPHA